MRPVPRLRRGGVTPPPWACRARGVLTTLAVIWVLALLAFSTFVVIQERHVLEEVNPGESDAQKVEQLQRHVKELQNHLKNINAKYDRLRRDSKLRADANAAGKDSGGGGVQRKGGEGVVKKNAAGEVQSMMAVAKPPAPAARPPQRQGDGQAAAATAAPPVVAYDSTTSPVPLVDPTAIAGKDLGFTPDPGLHCRDQGDRKILERTTVWEGATMGKPRILCLTYTLSKVHDTAVRSLRETWARKCDGYIAMSDLTDPSIPSIDIKHDGPEAYENMWQKSRSIWLYVYKHHLHDFDYFYIGGDDVYLIVENLRKYLLSEEIVRASEDGKKPLYLGRRFLPPNEKVVFNSGGAGYMLNQAALDVLGKGLKGNKCRAHQVGFWEDVNVAYCLSLAGVEAYDTRDPLGRERFLPFTPAMHLQYRVPKNPDWYAKYAFDLKVGVECCSTEAVSYHYVKGDLMQHMYAFLYGFCPRPEGAGGVST